MQPRLSLVALRTVSVRTRRKCLPADSRRGSCYEPTVPEADKSGPGLAARPASGLETRQIVQTLASSFTRLNMQNS